MASRRFCPSQLESRIRVGRRIRGRRPQPPGRLAWLGFVPRRIAVNPSHPSEPIIRVIHPSQSESPIRANPSHSSESDRGRLARAADGARGARRCAAASPPPRRSDQTPYPSQKPERHIRVRIRPLAAAALAQLPGSPAWAAVDRRRGGGDSRGPGSASAGSACGPEGAHGPSAGDFEGRGGGQGAGRRRRGPGGGRGGREVRGGSSESLVRVAAGSESPSASPVRVATWRYLSESTRVAYPSRSGSFVRVDPSRSESSVRVDPSHPSPHLTRTAHASPHRRPGPGRMDPVRALRARERRLRAPARLGSKLAPQLLMYGPKRL